MRQNIKCADGEDICVFCAVGDNLEDPDYCEYDDQKTEDGCPGFECSAQCRECPMDCEFLGK
jgi:hypothetical protein